MCLLVLVCWHVALVQQLAAQKELDDPVAEKLRRQKLVEEADHRITEELFGREHTSGVAYTPHQR